MLKTVVCQSVRNWRVLANQVTNTHAYFHMDITNYSKYFESALYS